MFKLAPVLLVAAGLAVGLWLGFNPQTHQQIVQNWDRAHAAVVQAAAKVQLAPMTLTSTKVNTAPHAQAPSASAAWKQITTALGSLVSSLQRMWLNITARVSSAR